MIHVSLVIYLIAFLRPFPVISQASDCYADNPVICQELQLRIEGHKEAIQWKRAMREMVAAETARAVDDASHHDNMHSMGLELPRRTADLAGKRASKDDSMRPDDKSSGRRLSASTAIPIRISPQFQLPAAMPAASQTLIQQVIWAAIKTMQLYLKVATAR